MTLLPMNLDGYVIAPTNQAADPSSERTEGIAHFALR